MASFDLALPESLNAALRAEALRTGRASASIIADALSQYLGLKLHTLFQVSTSGALVAGIFEREVSVRTVLEHGDFGLGTFADLDGEMVVLDGHAYQAKGTGEVSEAPPDAGAPFAVITRFLPGVDAQSDTVTNFADLEERCDRHRDSNNVFYAFRLDGRFAHLRARAVNPPAPMRTWWTRPSRRANSSLRTLTGRWSGFGHQDSQAPSRYPAIISTSCRTTANMAGTCSMSQPVP
jgi:acetolactate decarboxylase